MSAKPEKREQVRVCTACGKREGAQWWDVSCEIHAVHVWADTIIEGDNGRIQAATAVPVGEINS